MTKKSNDKLSKLVASLQQGPNNNKRAEDILRLIRNKKRESEIKFTIVVRDCITHLSQSEMHRIIADNFDAKRNLDLNEPN